jgi:hypothetical protein
MKLPEAGEYEACITAGFDFPVSTLNPTFCLDLKKLFLQHLYVADFITPGNHFISYLNLIQAF